MGTFTDFLGMIGGEAASAGMGMILGDINDARQLRQQGKLQEQQIQGQQRMIDYSMMKQLEMWKATNYSAQMAELAKAGLNPALLYGMKGGGGVTTGNASGNVSGGQAPSGGGEAIAMMQQGMQLQLLKAQKDNIQADTELKLADATKTKGVDTQEGVQRMNESQTRIQALEQGIDNAKQVNELQKIEIAFKHMEQYEQGKSQEDRLDRIHYETEKALSQMKIIRNDAYISSKTYNDKIAIIGQEAIGSVLRNTLTKAETANTVANTDVARQKVREIANGIMRDWDKMSMTEREIKIKEALKDWETDPNREAINKAIGALNLLVPMLKRGTTINNFYE